MKKILFLGLLIFFLSSCFSSPQKEEIIQDTEEKTENIPPSHKESTLEIKPLDKWDLISLNTPQLIDVEEGEIEITGTTLQKVEKIEVSFSNTTSSFPKDSYTLQTFNPGDTEFRYIASAKNQVLDYGVNEYIFTAYGENHISQVSVSLPFSETKGIIGGNSVETLLDKEDSLYTSSGAHEILSYPGKPHNFSLEKENMKPLDCSLVDEITEYLLAKYSSWVYWNTCRDIVPGSSISFNVLRTSQGNYMYEKHYYNYTHGTHGYMLLETGTGTTKENLPEKNKTLKRTSFDTQLGDDFFLTTFQ